MKRELLLNVLASGLLFGGAGLGRAETVEWNLLPSVVQRTINEQRGPLGIVSIERQDQFGSPVYLVRLNGPGANNEFYVSQAGTIVNRLAEMADRTLPSDETRQLTFVNLPTAVQNTVRSIVGNAPMGQIELVTGNGRTSYMVPYRTNNRLVDLWLDPNGTVLSSSPLRALLSAARQMRFEDLPRLVQDTLRSYASGGSIENVRRGEVDGRSVYEATINAFNRPLELRVGTDGNLISDSVNDRFLAQLGRLTGSNVATSPSRVRVPLERPDSISFNQLPSAVLTTLQRYAGSDFIEKLEKGSARGVSVYQAVLNHAGEKLPLRIADNGSLVSDDVNNWCLARLNQVMSSAVSDDWRTAPARAALSDVRRLSFNQLPLAVQDTLRYYVPGAPLQNLVEGSVGGDRVYQAEVRWRGQNTQLRIAEDGSLTSDRDNGRFLSDIEQTKGTAAGQAPASQTERGAGANTTILR